MRPGFLPLVCLLWVGACADPEALKFSSWEFFDASQSIRTSQDVVRRRTDMTQFVFGGPMPTRFPDDVELITDAAFSDYLTERVTVESDDLTSLAYLIHPHSWDGKLAIYHQGHRGDFRILGRSTIIELLETGHQVLAFSMPMVGMNTAIDERIDASYPVAASWPHYLRALYGSEGDYEQQITPNYLELYLMATHPNREQVQVFNEFDDCCFAGLVAYDYLAYTAYRANEWSGRFEILIDHDQVVHGITHNTLLEILEIEGLTVIR